MGYLSLVLLFSKNQSTQPPAILQCGTSGEYFPYFFVDWRDGVHYIFWCESNSKEPRLDESFETWRSAYGYDEEEEFVGNLNEFVSSSSSDPFSVFTSIGSISSTDDLNSKSAWDDSVKVEEYDSDSDNN